MLISAFLVSGGIFIPPTTSLAAAEEVSNDYGYYRGDVDGNGVVQASDARLILRASARLEDFSNNKDIFDRADYDGNGVISAADARMALRTSVQLETTVFATTATSIDVDIKVQDADAVLASDRSNIITSISTDFGTIAVLRDNRVAVYKDGKMQYSWNVKTSENDFLFDGDMFGRPPEVFRWYGIINNDIYVFANEYMDRVMTGVIAYDYSSDGWYCLCKKDNALYAWSPRDIAFIASDVNSAYVVKHHVFYNKTTSTRCYLMDADPYRVQQLQVGYSSAHPIKSVHLGSGSFYDYSHELADILAFNAKYGVDITKWGHPKFSVGVDDFKSFANKSYNDIYELFSIPSSKISNSFMFDDISFNGNEGSLKVSFKNNVASYASWTCYDSSESLYREFLAHLRTMGSNGEVRHPRVGCVEQGVVIGGRTIFAGYDSSSSSTKTYIFTEYQ